MNQLEGKIAHWATVRKLDKANPDKQMLKLMEEVGELAQGLAKNNREQVIDSIGDVFVVLKILSMQLGLNLQECVEFTYNEISERKGKMIDGVFVKEQDLNRLE